MRVFVSVLALGVGLLLPSTGCSRRAEPPHIILVMVDTLRADYLGAYGFDGPISPNLDALAAESVVFDNCIAPSPWTKPSIASVFTSLYPQVHGLTNHEGKYWGGTTPEGATGVLPDAAETLAEALSGAGYATAAFVSNPWIARRYGFAQGFDHFDESAAVNWDRADVLIEAARRWIETRDDERPFFVYLHLMDVHAPYDGSREDFLALFDSVSLGPEHRLGDRERPDRRWQNIETRPGWVDDPWRYTRTYWRARYASGVRAMDRRMAALLEFLRDEEILDHSLLMVTSDHGEELFEHQGWSHGRTLYEHQLRVPLLIRRPGARDAGSRVREVVELLDLMPTMLEVAGATRVERAQGRRLLDARKAVEERVALATATHHNPSLFSAQTLRHKLHYDVSNGESRLFDLQVDPGEHEDLARKEPALTMRLKWRLDKRLAESLAGGTLDRESAGIPDDLRKRLESLGYL